MTFNPYQWQGLYTKPSIWAKIFIYSIGYFEPEDMWDSYQMYVTKIRSNVEKETLQLCSFFFLTAVK